MSEIKHKIVIECNPEAKDNLLPILDTLRHLGSAGSSRSVTVEDHGNYFFDGDGPDRIHSISVDGTQVKDGDFMKVSSMPYINKSEAIDDLKKLDGDPPYDTPSNISRNDAYFGKSLEKKYGMPLEELRKEVNKPKRSSVHPKTASNFKDQLIKLGSEVPELRKHLTPVISALESDMHKEAAASSLYEALTEEFQKLTSLLESNLKDVLWDIIEGGWIELDIDMAFPDHAKINIMHGNGPVENNYNYTLVVGGKGPTLRVSLGRGDGSGVNRWPGTDDTRAMVSSIVKWIVRDIRAQKV